VKKMGYTLACKDLGMDCSYVAKAENEEELMSKAVEHGKKVHGYTDEQLKDPELLKKVKAAVKHE
jgi:predicted small metal-binding protein